MSPKWETGHLGGQKVDPWELINTYTSKHCKLTHFKPFTKHVFEVAPNYST
jgi:hypothetical protein